MADAALPSLPQPATPAGQVSEVRTWYWALAQCFILLAVLGWLLARLIWLYYFFGLFFFLVAGLLVGAIAFRSARPARPVAKARLLVGICAVSFCAGLVVVFWEYRHFVDTIGTPPRFAQARNAAVERGESPRRVQELASEEFRRVLGKRWPPGGPIGYVRWSVARGETRLAVAGQVERVTNPHAGVVWILRTAAAFVLMAAGLWFSLESLRQPVPVCNVLLPGEEYEDAD